MKKSLNLNLIVVGLASVIALTACERRERPVKKTAPTSTSTNTNTVNTQPSGTPSSTPSGQPSGTPSGQPSGTPSSTPSNAPVAKEAFTKSVENLAALKTVMEKRGYVIVEEPSAAGGIEVSFDQEALLALQKKLLSSNDATASAVDIAMNCELVAFGENHANHINAFANRQVEGVTEAEVKASLERSVAMAEAAAVAREYLKINELPDTVAKACPQTAAQ